MTEETLMPAIEEHVRSVCQDLETRLRSLVEDLQRAAEKDRLTAVHQARSAAFAERDAAIAELRAAANAERDAIVREIRASAEVDLARTVMAEVSRARTEAADALQRELARVRAESAEITVEEVARVRAEVAKSLAEQVNRVKAESAISIAEEVARARADAARSLLAEITAARIEERQAVLAGIDRMLRAIRRLDDARSLTDVLDALIDAARDEATRVALVVKQNGDRVQFWRTSGFGSGLDGRRDVPAGDLGIVTRAMETSEPTTQAGPSDAGGPHFPSVPHDRVALAVPIRVGGRVVAVLYADDASEGERSVPAAWPETLEILARHAGRCLESLTALRSVTGVGAHGATPTGDANAHPATSDTSAAQITRPAPAPPPPSGMDDEARRYAHLLVNEIRRHHEGAVMAGRQQRDILQRLGPQIEQAWRIYEDQVPADVTARRLYFDEEVLSTLANGDPTLLG